MALLQDFTTLELYIMVTRACAFPMTTTATECEALLLWQLQLPDWYRSAGQVMLLVV
jgi:hypothetical protein